AARLVHDQDIPGIPTRGFNVLRLLDFLDVNPVIDLVGFDFYETGPYRIKEAMGLAVSPMHSHQDGKAWGMSHAPSSDEMRISLRGARSPPWLQRPTRPRRDAGSPSPRTST